MIHAYHVENTAGGEARSDQATWMELAGALFSMGAVGVMEQVGEKYNIFARVIGFCDDPVFGRIICIQSVDEEGHPVSPPDEEGAGV